MTRRDQGNFFAGRAAKMLGLSKNLMLSGFGAFQSSGNKKMDGSILNQLRMF